MEPGETDNSTLDEMKRAIAVGTAALAAMKAAERSCIESGVVYCPRTAGEIMGKVVAALAIATHDPEKFVSNVAKFAGRLLPFGPAIHDEIGDGRDL